MYILPTGYQWGSSSQNVVYGLQRCFNEAHGTGISRNGPEALPIGKAGSRVVETKKKEEGSGFRMFPVYPGWSVLLFKYMVKERNVTYIKA